MTAKHSIQILGPGSHYVGRQCPVRRTELRSGDQVVVCHKSNEAISWSGWPALEGRCPYCDQFVTLQNETYQESDQTFEHTKKGQKQKPGYQPARRSLDLSPTNVFLLVILLLGLGGALGIGASVGYRHFFASPTAISEVANLPITEPTATPPLSATSTKTLPAAVLSTSTHLPNPTATSPPTPTPQPTSTTRPSPTAVPSPTPCAISVASRFANAWSRYADELGCPVNQSHSHDAATQDFEYGFLLWRIDPDQVYVMYDNGHLGLYPMTVYPESVRQNPPGADPNIHPPAGLQQPVRGFGLIWRDNPEVREGVGWAVEGEARADWYYGFVAQDFVGGTIFHECRMGVRVLLWSGTWIKVSEGDPCA